MNRINDYTRCPKCNSTDLRVINGEEEQSSVPAAGNASVADELKKFKELLDLGIITEEEFNTQKAKLLGM
ncbi:MAG: SHOCT domain-containing protein [Clostridia bacterium]|nr:SHOCT domain-containing protein [Clostridia bacterium]